MSITSQLIHYHYIYRPILFFFLKQEILIFKRFEICITSNQHHPIWQINTYYNHYWKLKMNKVKTRGIHQQWKTTFFFFIELGDISQSVHCVYFQPAKLPLDHYPIKDCSISVPATATTLSNIGPIPIINLIITI